MRQVNGSTTSAVSQGIPLQDRPDVRAAGHAQVEPLKRLAAGRRLQPADYRFGPFVVGGSRPMQLLKLQIVNVRNSLPSALIVSSPLEREWEIAMRS
jgi:hypothetical protein